MSDASRQAAGKAVRQTGTTDEQARLLRERVRAGELTDQQLRVAALLGEPGAAEALGEPPVRLPTTCEDASAWLDDLAQVGRRVRALLVGALVDVVLAAGDAGAPGVRDPEVALMDALRRHAQDERDVSLDDVDGLAEIVVAFTAPDEEPGFALRAARALHGRRALDAFVDSVAGEVGDAAVLVNAIVRALRPWALGEVVPAEPAGPARPYSPTSTYERGERWPTQRSARAPSSPWTRGG